MKLASFLLLSGALLLGACRSDKDKAKDEKTDTTTTTTTEEKKASRPPPPPVDEGIDVPTEETFEDEAAAQITDTSDLGKALDALEKEIDK
jgi:hypothetical protein